MSRSILKTAAKIRGTLRVPDVTIRGPQVRYLSAVLAVSLALLAQQKLTAHVGTIPPFLVFYPAVLATALLAGGGPGILATAGSALCAAWYFLPPFGAFSLLNRATLVSLAIFIAMNAALCALAETLREARRDKDAAQRLLAKAHADVQAEKEWLSRVLHSIADEVWLTDKSGRYTLANPAALREFGHDSVEGMEVQAAIAGLQVMRGDGSIRPPSEAPPLRALAGEIVRDEEQIVHTPHSGELRHRQVSASPVRNAQGEIIGSVSVVRDITERKRTESALQEADRRKSVFLATLSHELRNPLAPIRTAARLLESEQLSHADLARCRRIIARQVTQMASLLDDLLDVSRIERGEVALKKSPVELRQVLDAAVETARPLIDARQHRLSLDIESLPVMLFADPVGLTQVVSNLLTNAAKYTDPGGTIELRARTSPGGLVLSIKDDGLGIDAELRARIFEMFEQAHSERSRVDGGLGIGLALAKAYVQMHGGTIDVASEGRGRGSEFTVMLPATILASTRGAGQEEARTDAAFAAAPPASSSAPAAIPPAPAARRVLVADDNRDAAESVALLLTTAGYEVYTAFDGPEALEKVRRLQPDVALLDIGMPGLNGFTVAQHIRSSPWGGHVRLIALPAGGTSPTSDRQSPRASMNT